MDLTPTILSFAPVCLPLALKAQIDPIYFGFMFVYVGCLGLITPPVGTVLNVVAGVGRIKMESVIKGVTPFLAVYLSLLVLFVLFPQLIIAPARWRSEEHTSELHSLMRISYSVFCSKKKH